MNKRSFILCFCLLASGCASVADKSPQQVADMVHGNIWLEITGRNTHMIWSYSALNENMLHELKPLYKKCIEDGGKLNIASNVSVRFTTPEGNNYGERALPSVLSCEGAC